MQLIVKSNFNWVMIFEKCSKSDEFSIALRVYQSELMDITEKIEKVSAEMKVAQTKMEENVKLIDQRRKTIGELDASLSMLRLAITEIETFEYLQEVDVEFMVSKGKNCTSFGLSFQ